MPPAKICAVPALLLEEETLQKEEQGLLDKRAKFQSVGGTPDVLGEVETELMRIRARHETLKARINSSDRFSKLLRPELIRFSDIRSQTTDAETYLLEFSLGSRKSYLWLVTPDGLTSFELPDKQTIERAALGLASMLNDPKIKPDQEDSIRAAAADLSKLVLGPVAGKLHAQRMIIVPDGILQYIPFQILTDPLRPLEPLVARHEIVNAPSASTLVLLRQETAGRTTAPKLLAAFGDPVFSSNYALKSPAPKGSVYGDQASVGDRKQRGLASNMVDTLEPSRVQPLFSPNKN
jgi:CHAT domain-containing protein